MHVSEEIFKRFRGNVPEIPFDGNGGDIRACRGGAVVFAYLSAVHDKRVTYFRAFAFSESKRDHVPRDRGVGELSIRFLFPVEFAGNKRGRRSEPIVFAALILCAGCGVNRLIALRFPFYRSGVFKAGRTV